MIGLTVINSEVGFNYYVRGSILEAGIFIEVSDFCSKKTFDFDVFNGDTFELLGLIIPSLSVISIPYPKSVIDKPFLSEN